eukprot:scaffold1220_cov376-Prasinococcus_capsulatus_cf.AAC.17
MASSARAWALYGRTDHAKAGPRGCPASEELALRGLRQRQKLLRRTKAARQAQKERPRLSQDKRCYDPPYHVKHEGCIGRNDATSAAGSVGKLAWDYKLALAALLHRRDPLPAEDALIPSFDNLAYTHVECQGTTTVVRRVKCEAGRQLSSVVATNRLSCYGRWTCAFLYVTAERAQGNDVITSQSPRGPSRNGTHQYWIPEADVLYWHSSTA